MKKLDVVPSIIITVVVALCYLIIGFITSSMSGMGNIFPIMIYSAVVTFFISLLLLSRDEVSDAQGYSGIIFVISSIVFLHTSAPIWGEKQYCQSQYEVRGNNVYTFNNEKLEFREGTGLYKDYNNCSDRGFSYMMEKGAIHPFLYRASSIIASISLFILIASHAELIKRNSSPSKRKKRASKKNNKPINRGIALLEKELLECEKIVADFKKNKKINLDAKLTKSFFTKLKKLSEMLIYFLEFQSDDEYYMRESRIDKLQIYASKQADQTFKGDKRKIAKIKGELSYTAGQGDYFSQDQVDKWWKKYK